MSLFEPNFFDDFRYANGTHHSTSNCQAILKSEAQDFLVTEEIAFDLDNEGEHFWLFVEKTQRHTTDVAKQLAKHVGIAAKHVGFSGMKDHQAVTRQWFSLWMPNLSKLAELDFSELDDPSIRILKQSKHTKKLKRGVHKANHFKIRLREFSGDKSHFEHSVQRLSKQGVPNYFGKQRFGFQGENLVKAKEWFEKGYRIKQVNKRSLLLSSVRSYLFNTVLSKRIELDTWLEPQIGEPLNLAGSQSVFVCDDAQVCKSRLDAGDLSTTAVMWGADKRSQSEGVNAMLQEFIAQEAKMLDAYSLFKQGLESAGLTTDRRALRCMPQVLEYGFEDQDLYLSFSLQKGHYATMLLRELIDADEVKKHAG